MNKVILIGQLDNNEEIKVFGEKNTEVLELKIEGIKCKAFGELATKIKSLKGYVIADGMIKLHEYTNKENKKVSIQEITISKIEPLLEKKQEQAVDNWSSAKDIEPDELPFY